MIKAKKFHTLQSHADMFETAILFGLGVSFAVAGGDWIHPFDQHCSHNSYQVESEIIPEISAAGRLAPRGHDSLADLLIDGLFPSLEPRQHQDPRSKASSWIKRQL